MRIDWKTIQIQPKFAGKFLSQKGVATDPTWKYLMFDQTLWYVRSGQGQMILPQGEVRLKAGACFWLRPGFEYRYWQNPARPLGTYAIHFELLMPDGRLRPSDEPLPPELLHPPNPKYVAKVAERLVGANPEWNIWGAAMTPLARKQTICLLTALLMELDATAGDEPSVPRHEPPHVAHINDLARRIREDPTQFASVADMSREFHCSASSFSQLFRKIQAYSPHEALILSRVRHAAHMLLETKLPIKEIAKRLTYHDVHFFTRQFRKYMGTTPARYRKKQRKIYSGNDSR